MDDKKEEQDPMKLLLDTYFSPLSRMVRSNLFYWALENLDTFLTDIMDSPIESYEETKLEVETWLKLEVLMGVMQVLEDFVRIIKSFKFSTKDPIFEFRKRIDSTAFYKNEITEPNLSDHVLLDYLSFPEIQNLDSRKSEVDNGIAEMKKIIVRARGEYLKYIDLYTSYKHGNRVSVIESWNNPETFEDLFAVIAYLHDKGKRNEIVFLNGIDVTELKTLEKVIINTSLTIKKNWYSTHSESNEYNLSFPKYIG